MDEDEIKVGERYDVRGYALERQTEDEPSRVRRFRASTPDKDRHRSRILPEGIDTKNFMKNPIFLWAHDGYGGWDTPRMEHVLGRVVKVEKNKQALDVDVEFLDAEVNPLAEMALNMLEAKALNAVSIGFIPREIKLEKDADGSDRDVPLITKSELLEISLVPIPSNPNALELARSMVAADLKAHHPHASLRWACEKGCEHDTLKAAEECASCEPGTLQIGDIEIKAPVEQLPFLKELLQDPRGATTYEDLPLADRDHEWDSSSAVRRVRRWAGDDEMNWRKYRRAFFWFDSEDIEAFGSYRLPFVDVIDGRLMAVPRGILTWAERLDQTDISDQDRDRVRNHMGRYYEKMREEFDDDDLVPPWEKAVAAPPAEGAADRGVDAETVRTAFRSVIDEHKMTDALRSVVGDWTRELERVDV